MQDGRTQSIIVELGEGKEFLVNGRLRVPQNRLDTWLVKPQIVL